MAILVTGASGFIGRALVPLLLDKGHKVYGLFRKPPEAYIPFRFIPLIGDILEPDLGLKEVPEDITMVHHLAGIHRLGEDKDGAIWKTNVVGTKNVLNFCVKHAIDHLYFTSTAYAWPVNPYGLSKIRNEADIEEYAEYGIKPTVFKPSIVMGVPLFPYPGHFMQFVSAVVKVHQRAELIRRKIEGTLRLPVIEPVFRIKGNPNGKLNLIQVDQVVWGMANIENTGTFWLTNPNPPTLKQLTEWIGEFIMVDLQVLSDFKPTPIEAAFQKMSTAFEPYMQGDNFKSNLQLSPPITKAFIQDTIQRSL